MANATVWSNSTGNTANSSVSLNNTRRVFNFGDRVAELAPQQSPFFVYLSKVAKKATNDPVFKFLEQRHQWQRRNFEFKTAFTAAEEYVANEVFNATQDPEFTAKYNEYGQISSGAACTFLLPGQVLAMKADDGEVYYIKINSNAVVESAASSAADATEISHGTTDGDTTIAGEMIAVVEKTIPNGTVFSAGNQCQVVGSAWAEGTDSPLGWEDKMYDREGYTQIFKTGMNIFSGTSMATEYRGNKDEYQRIWQDKLMEHKMDLEHAFLYGRGSNDNRDGGADGSTNQSGGPIRTTWGIVPYTESFGKVYNMSYSSSGYDAFLDAMEDFFAAESGNSGEKLVLASRKIITYLNKLGAGSFMNNSVGSSQYRLDVNQIPGAFGHTVTVVNTIFGNLHFVAEPLLRGPWEDYCVCVDLSNVAYRPLVGNGVSRDTFIETNVQDPGVDGRQDQILTEAGLEISLPETHAIIKFS
jgi:hypothetical protein